MCSQSPRGEPQPGLLRGAIKLLIMHILTI